MSSPYKKLRSTNDSWIGYINMSKLNQHKAYKMLCITPTDHPQYGHGQQATIQGSDGRKWRTQLPGKYLSSLSSDDIDQIKKDMNKDKHPYLVYRETMMDKSYRIDIIENSPDLDEKHRLNLDVDELEASLAGDDKSFQEESQDTTEKSLTQKKHKETKSFEEEAQDATEKSLMPKKRKVKETEETDEEEVEKSLD